MQPVFDGHNDVLSRLHNAAALGRDPVAEFIDGAAGADGRRAGHIDLPRARAGGLAGGFCAIYLSSPDFRSPVADRDGRYASDLPAPLDQPSSRRRAFEMIAIAERIEAAGGWRICRSTQDIRRAMAEGAFAAVLHLEGAEPIDRDLDTLHEMHRRGLRSLGPVWSRNNDFGFGVPFAYPADPDIGPGLTDAGKALVRECDRLGIMIDLAHLNEKGFRDVAALSSRPLVATHSNAHALAPVARNLTDRQLDAIAESRGVVGLNFARGMLDPRGREEPDLDLSMMVDHIDHLAGRLGIEGVAIGSDFDGAPIPAGIGDAAGLQALVEALAARGYGADDLAKICRENWLRVLGVAWGEA